MNNENITNSTDDNASSSLIFKTKKINFVEYAKSWTFWYKVILASLILFCVAFDMINTCINVPDKPIYQQFIYKNSVGDSVVDYVQIIIWYLSYFTVQSNLLVAVWMIYAAVHHFDEANKKFTNVNMSLFMAIYITITGLIYNGLLMPIALKNGDYDEWGVFEWFKNEMQHSISPILAVVYVLAFLKVNETKPAKVYLKNESWKSLFYPLAYGAYSFIKQGVMVLEGFKYENTAQYPFLDMKNKWLLFIIAAIAIIIIGVGISTLYNFIISKRIGQKTNGTN